MKYLVLFTLLIVCTGCTTLRPIEGSPTELRQRLDSGELRVLLVGEILPLLQLHTHRGVPLARRIVGTHYFARRVVD